MDATNLNPAPTPPTAPVDPERPLTEPEAADFMRVHVRTLRRWRNRGDLRAVRAGGRVLYRRAELLRYLRDRER